MWYLSMYHLHWWVAAFIHQISTTWACRWSSCACVEAEESRPLLSSSRAWCSHLRLFSSLLPSPCFSQTSRRSAISPMWVWNSYSNARLDGRISMYEVGQPAPSGTNLVWRASPLWRGWPARLVQTLTVNHQLSLLTNSYLIILNSGVFNMQSPDSSPRTTQKVWFSIIIFCRCSGAVLCVTGL